MNSCDLIIANTAQLVTCASLGRAKKGPEMLDVGIIEGGAVAVRDGKIVGVGETSSVLEEFSTETLIDAKGKVVCPGFVDPHTHIVFGGNRLDEFELRIKGASYLEIMEAGGGIVSTVQHTRESSVEELVLTARKRLDVMLQLGCTTVEIKTGYGLDRETEVKMLVAIEELDKTHSIDIVPTFLAAHAIPADWKGKEDEFTDLICDEMIPAAWDWYQNSHFSRVGADTEGTESTEKRNVKKEWSKRKKHQDEDFLTDKNDHAEKEKNGAENFEQGSKSSVCSVAGTAPFFIDVFCEQNAFNLKQAKQVIETAAELGFKIKAHVDEFTNLGCAEFAIEAGATSIDHLDATNDSEIEMLATSDTVGIVTPTVNFNLGSKEFADARKMIDAGCAMALSTDYNPGSAPCSSQPLAMAIASRYQKLLPSETLNAITINAAFAVGLGETRGSVEVGKQADLLILDTDDYRQVAYEFGRNFVETVIKSGVEAAINS